MNPQDSFIYTQFEPGSFWDRKRKVVISNTLPFQLDMLRKTGRYDAFDLKWHSSYSDPPTCWPVPNHLFWDSDVAKWIEGMSYFPKGKGPEDSELQAAVADLVEKIRKAQQPDGYLNIHFTVVDPKGRFTNLRDLHELYNAGHLIEAALAHSRRYSSDALLEPLRKYTDLFVRTFGRQEGQIRGYPGHPEIELALLRLYKRTGDQKALSLARYFIEERGNPAGVDGKHYYTVEAAARGEGERTQPQYYPAPRSYWYNQAHKPILEQETIEGHSVRAMYLLTAAADLAIIDQKEFRPKYEVALRRLWENMVYRKMYLNGGIGAMKQWEGFGIDYFLPQSTDEGGCYSETCAAIGVMMFAERMLQLDLNGEYGDILERCLYNAMLTGMSLDGRAFTYVNQMASSSGNPSKREEWFECACCPPNVARVLGHVGGYLWSPETTGSTSASINVHLYASATLDYTLENTSKQVKLTQTTNWPWEGDVEFSLSADESVATTMRLRIPAWAEDFEITPKPPALDVKKGYLTLSPDYLRQNPKFKISVPLRPRLIHPHPYTNQNIAVVARGPVIYCLEDADHPWVEDHFKSLVLKTSDFASQVKEEKKSDLPMGESYVGITVPKAGYILDPEKTTSSSAAHTDGAIDGNTTNGHKSSATSMTLDFPAQKTLVDPSKEPLDLHFIPYFARANRGGKGMMRVGLRVMD